MDELMMLEMEFPGVQDYFNELNKENVEKEKQAKQAAFAEAKN